MTTTHRRGVTMLEALLATVLLSMIGATLAGAISAIALSHERAEQRLGASELGNRLMLQYIDDQGGMPSDALEVEYNGWLYRWNMDVQPVRFEMVNPPLDEESESQIGAGFSFDRVQLVIIKVWLGEKSGGSRGNSADVPNTTITRLIDPLVFPNPDSLQTLIEQPGGIEQLFERFMQIQGGNGQ